MLQVVLRKCFIEVIQIRIDEDCEWADPPTDDRTNLGGETFCIPAGRIVAELEIDPIEEVPAVGVGHNEQRAKFGPGEFQVSRAGDRVERSVKAGLGESTFDT